MRFRLKQLPRILIVHIKRFSWTGQKLRNPLNFDEEIQIDAEYICLSPQKYQTHQEVSRELNHVYRLYALIVHEGNSTTQGHYYAYIKNLENSNWYRYDDSVVTKVGKDLSNVKKNTQNVYIMFYQKYYIDEMTEEDSKNDQSQHEVIQSIKRSRKPSFYRQFREKNGKKTTLHEFMESQNQKSGDGCHHFDLFEKLQPTDEKILSAQYTRDGSDKSEPSGIKKSNSLKLQKIVKKQTLKQKKKSAILKKAP